jgi:tRNA threonylcarbamoyladenosine biosynthesis protein TsaE
MKPLLSESETKKFGSKLAGCFCSSPVQSSVIYLKGDLGSGKTTFAKGFLNGMGFLGNVASPTYTLIEIYNTKFYDVYHIDLYRIDTRKEIIELELHEQPASSHPFILLIEWPERGIPDILPPDLEILFSLGDLTNQRIPDVICNSKKLRNILNCWLK